MENIKVLYEEQWKLKGQLHKITNQMSALQISYMQSLFVRPGFCIRFTSDSASQRMPLPPANSSSSYSAKPVADFHRQVVAH